MSPALLAAAAGLIALAAPRPAHAETIECELASCIRIAHANHPLLKGGEAARREAQAMRAERVAERRPTLSAELGSGYFDGERIGPFDVLRGGPEERVRASGAYYQAGASMNIPIYARGAFIGANASGVKAADLAISEQDSRLRSLRTQVASGVVDAYSLLARSSAAQATYERIAELRQTAQRLAREQFKRELVSRRDLLLAEARAAEAQRDIAVNRAQLQRARLAMASALALKPGDSVQVQEPAQPLPAPSLSMEALIERVLQLSPDVRAQELRVAHLREEAARVKSEHGPDLSLRLFGGRGDDFNTPGGTQYHAFMQLRIPIVDFGLGSAKADAVQAKAAAEAARLETLRLDIGRAVADTYYRLAALASEREALSVRVDAAREELALAKAMAQKQLASVLAAADAEAEYVRLQAVHADAGREEQLLRYRLNLALAE
jgi:outer membrane protein TolC